MAQADKTPDFENFSKEIEDNIDSLFSPSKDIEIDPLTSEIKDATEDSPFSMETPSLDDAFADIQETAPKTEFQDAPLCELKELLNRLNQSLMTLEWEITPESTESALKHLDAVGMHPETQADDGLLEIHQKMTTVLKTLADTPQDTPSSAPRALQMGFEAFSFLAGQEEGADESEVEKFVMGAVQNLDAVIAHGVSSEASAEIFAPASDKKDDTFDDFKFDVLEEVKKELPKAEGPEQPLMDETAAAETQSVEPASAAAAEIFEPEAATGPGKAQVRSDAAKQMAERIEALSGAIRHHISILNDCNNRIRPIEKLLSNTRGMEKLYKFQHGIRSRLLDQKEFLLRALEGETLEQLTGETAREEIRASASEYVHVSQDTIFEKIPCPWNELSCAQWAGRAVAFDPAEIAFAGPAGRRIRKGLHQKDTFHLKNLKPWPWSRLQPLLKGPLADQDEASLKRIEFKILHNSRPSPAYTGPRRNPFLLILYKEGSGMVLVLDAPLKPLSAPPHSSWEDRNNDDSQWAGLLKTDDEAIPVATVESLLS